MEYINDIEYVLYCRKSTDETSWKQTQSIPDQIRSCIKYANDNGLKIKDKPKDFSDFESEKEIEDENNLTDTNNRETLLSTRWLFIIKEQESAKKPNNRPKWRKLISLIKKWKIRWIISYSPDRQARNLLEAWELIDIVDKNKLPENKKLWKIILDLKYPNFHFDDNASWKMMLGIWFVFSKQYADKLSEDIWRWNESKVLSWKALGRYKPWYIINDDGFHEPHPEFYELIREAFNFKLYENKSDSYIEDYLNTRGFHREYKNGRKEKLNSSWMYKWRVDDFYYWIFIHWNHEVDLRHANPYYKPMITEEEFNILMERHLKNNNSWKREPKDDNSDLTPIERWTVITADGYVMTDNVPNKGRHEANLKKALEAWEKVTMADIVKPHQIRFWTRNKNSKYKKLEINFSIIDEAIWDLLKGITLSEEAYKSYRNFMWKAIEDRLNEKKAEETKLTRHKNRIKNKRDDFIKKAAFTLNRDEKEEEVYRKERARFDKDIENIDKQIKNLEISERNEVLEFEMLWKIIVNAHKYREKANYVQKRKLAKIFVSNIKITSSNTLDIAITKGLEGLFSLFGGLYKGKFRGILDYSIIYYSYP